MRGLYLAAYLVLGSWLPARVPGARRLRAWLADGLCVSVHPSANIHEHVALCRELVVHDRAGIGARSRFVGGARIELGRRLRMGPDCMFIAGDHRIPDRDQTFDDSGSFSAPITVEDDVFIGARAIILRGVTIGRGSAVGAGAVVSRDVSPFTVVAGNPARLVRRLGAGEAKDGP